MLPTEKGAIRLFQFSGINVFLHWSWFVVAVIEMTDRGDRYSSVIWNLLEYLSLFLIVLLHEFGHSLACRQVGGRAHEIILWPLGGVAYVAPPPRPGATLWSIAAGPLVNVVLLPLLSLVWYAATKLGLRAVSPDAYVLVKSIWYINAGLLAFNLLPIYPLDGGQILRSLLWFLMGRSRSLMVASIIGSLGALAVVFLAWQQESIWLGIVSAFILFNCWRGLTEARVLSRLESVPRHEHYFCPSCKMAPPHGPFWVCGNCRHRFDIFDGHGVCPHCAAHFIQTPCMHCGALHPIDRWYSGPPMPPRWPS